MSKSFACLCALLGSMFLKTTVHHEQTNGKTEKYNRTMLARICIYVNGPQTDCDNNMHFPNYRYSAKCIERRAPIYSVPDWVANRPGQSSSPHQAPWGRKGMERWLLGWYRVNYGTGETYLPPDQTIRPMKWGSFMRNFDHRVRNVSQLLVGDCVYDYNDPKLSS